MSATADVNTTLANLEKTYALNVRRAKEEASRLVLASRRPENASVPESVRDCLAKAKMFLEEARAWEKQRATAADGYLLVTQENLSGNWMQQYAEVFNECNGSGRIVWYEGTAIGDNIILDAYAMTGAENLAVYGFIEPNGQNGATGS